MRIPRPNRDEQIAIMTGVEERIQGYFARWKANPKFREALHRNDPAVSPETEPQRVRRLA